MTNRNQDLARAIFAPRGIAIVGASSDPTKTSYRPLDYLIKGGFAGHIYPVNPGTPEILGRQTLPSIAALPDDVDLAFILLPTDAAITAVAECGAKGIAAAIVLASGFSETGAEGIEREKRLAEAARSTGIRILGPSSLGFVNLHEKLVLTGNAAFAESGHAPGGVFCASQSGSMIGALLSRGNAKSVGFAGLVSVGGEVDLSVGSLCEATLEDPRITGYMLFLETLRDAAALRRFAVGAAAKGRPIVALKLGRSDAAAEIAVSHTGALAGEDDIADAFLADCGIARVESLEALLEAGSLMQRLPPRHRPGHIPTVGVITTTGGGAAMVVDQLGMRGVNIEGPDPETLAAISAIGPKVAPARIVDLTLAGTRPDVMAGALRAMLASDKYDLIVAVAGSSARFQPELAVKPIVDVAKDDGRLAAFLVPEAPDALAMLRENGVPCFRTPESCADSVAAALRRRPARALDIAPPPVGKSQPLDEAAGYELLDGLGVAHPRSVPVAANATTVDPALYPAAVKVLHRDITHKTDVGGVILGVKSDADLTEAIRKIVTNVGAKVPGVTVERLLVQNMAAGGLAEVLIGYRIDPQVGPIVLLAAGGIQTEIYKDRSVRMAPVDRQTALDMIEEVRGLKVLAGFRGRPRGDIDALADAIVAVSRVHDHAGGRVTEMEINPLHVMPAGQGVRAVDVLAFVAG